MTQCHQSTFEADIDPDNWQTVWRVVAADAVLCGPSPIIAEFVERKGRTAKCISSPSMVQALGRLGIPTETKVLSESEQQGRERLAATPVAIEAVDTVWGWLYEYGLTNGKQKPPVGTASYRQRIAGAGMGVWMATRREKELIRRVAARSARSSLS